MIKVLVDGLEVAVVNVKCFPYFLERGEEISIPEDWTVGERDESLVQMLSKEELVAKFGVFAGDVESLVEGVTFGPIIDGIWWKIVSIEEGIFTLDGNHPFAGKTLHYEFTEEVVE